MPSRWIDVLSIKAAKERRKYREERPGREWENQRLPLYSLLDEIMLIIQAHLAKPDQLAMSRVSHRLWALSSYEVQPQTSIVDRRTFTKRLERDSYHVLCDLERHEDQQYATGLICSSCRIKHAIRFFSPEESCKPAEERKCFGTQGGLFLCSHLVLPFEALAEAYEITDTHVYDPLPCCVEQGCALSWGNPKISVYQNQLRIANEPHYDPLVRKICKFGAYRPHHLAMNVSGYVVTHTYYSQSTPMDTVWRHSAVLDIFQNTNMFICPHIQPTDLAMNPKIYQGGALPTASGELKSIRCTKNCCGTTVVVSIIQNSWLPPLRKQLCITVHEGLGALIDATHPLWLSRAIDCHRDKYDSQMEAYVAAGGPSKPARVPKFASNILHGMRVALDSKAWGAQQRHDQGLLTGKQLQFELKFGLEY